MDVFWLEEENKLPFMFKIETGRRDGEIEPANMLITGQ